MKAIRIQTVSQWYLLKQLNNYLGKRKIPEEVMRKIYRILYEKKLGKDGFIALCLKKVRDDFIGIEELVDFYPYRLFLEEKIDEIQTGIDRNKSRSWYVTYAKVKGQQTNIAVIYTTKEKY